MHPLLKSWKIRIAALLVILALATIAIKGIKLGTDFTGGTVLLFKFDRKLNPDEIKEAVTILEKRLNWTGLMDVTVRPWGDRYIYVRIGDVDPDQVNFIKQSILRQGKFEAVVKGEVALEGRDIILKGGYSIYPDHINGGFRWEVPFLLTDRGAKRFFGTLKKYCTIESCPDNFFFIDRPAGAIIIMDQNLYEREKEVPTTGKPNSSSTVDINEVILNAGAKLVVVKDANDVDDIEINVEGKKVILPSTLSTIKSILEEKNVEVVVVPVLPNRSWIWDATNLRAIIGVSPQLRAEIVSAPEDNPVVTTSLSISGWAPTKKEAEKRVEELRIILSSGSLPAGLSIVQELTIPPTYGYRSFLVFMGAIVVAAVAVGLFIALRYRHPNITIPIVLTMLSEVVLILGFASLIGWRLDVPSLVGIIAAIGSGVDDQIIITDELLRRSKKEDEKVEELSLIKRIKRAFFVVFASASALGVVMIPLWMSGIPTLMGFALTTLAGIIFGIFITRQAYAEAVKYLLSRGE